jgi:hypothetical protein
MGGVTMAKRQERFDLVVALTFPAAIKTLTFKQRRARVTRLSNRVQRAILQEFGEAAYEGMSFGRLRMRPEPGATLRTAHWPFRK